MIKISYSGTVIGISFLWILIRAMLWHRKNEISLKREIELLLVYICVIVVVRFTFFPFSKVNGQVQALHLDPSNIFPPRFNLIPFAHIADYETCRESLINIIGNTAMFLPLGIVWPSVFRELNTHWKVIAAGAGTSLTIEFLQLPFFERVSDIDDLILNCLGFLLGYGIFLLFRTQLSK